MYALIIGSGVRAGAVEKMAHEWRCHFKVLVEPSALGSLLGSCCFDFILMAASGDRDEDAETIRSVRLVDGFVPMLVLSKSDDFTEKIRLFDAGADACVDSSCVDEELLARLDALLRRTGRATENVYSGIVRIGKLRLSLDERQFYYFRTPLLLTPREFMVLEALVLARGRIVTMAHLHQELAARGRPRGRMTHIKSESISVYISRLRKKIVGLGVILRTIPHIGYCIEQQ